MKNIFTKIYKFDHNITSIVSISNNRRHATTATTAAETAATAAIKSYDEMPQIPSVPLIFGHLSGKLDVHRPHDQWRDWYRTYGDVVKIELLGNKTVFSFNPDHWQLVHSKVGKYPGPLQLSPWLYYEQAERKKNPNYQMNLIALEGEEWRANRTVLDQVFSSIPAVKKYIPSVSSIADDFVKRLEEDIVDQNNRECKDLTKLLYSYTNEVVGQAVYGYRLGNLSPSSERNVDTTEFFTCLHELFGLFGILLNSLHLYRYYDTKDYKRMKEIMKTMEEIGVRYIERADEEHKKAGFKEDVTSLLTHMRKNNQSLDLQNKNSTTMFMAGSDSTTHTISWLLHNLGRFPKVQERLREEVKSVLKGKTSIDAEDVHNMKLVRAALKESMRFTPSAAGLPRILKEECNVGGYIVPPGTMIVLNTIISNFQDRFFRDPLEFKPERFLTDGDKSLRSNPWSHLPFGFGPRVCQAFRLAEIESFVIVAKLLLYYRWTSLEEVKPYAVIFNEPEITPKIKWERL